MAGEEPSKWTSRPALEELGWYMGHRNHAQNLRIIYTGPNGYALPRSHAMGWDGRDENGTEWDRRLIDMAPTN